MWSRGAEGRSKARRIAFESAAPLEPGALHSGLRASAASRSRSPVARSATLGNAEILGRRGELGVVAPGARFDLLRVDGDPLAHVALLARLDASLALVMKGESLVRSRLF